MGWSPDCYLCPTNLRATGTRNPDYRETFVFTNDFAALLPAQEGTAGKSEDALLRIEPESGMCRVICYSPSHNLTLSRMRQAQVVSIIAAWIKEYKDLGSRDDVNHVQIFENRGQIMGCSNPHPHGQIWANSTIPAIPARERSGQNFAVQEIGAPMRR